MAIESFHLKASDQDPPSKETINNFSESLATIQRKAISEGVKFYTIPGDADVRVPGLLSPRLGGRKTRSLYCTRLHKTRLDSKGNIIHCYAIRQEHGSLLQDEFSSIWNVDSLKKFRTEMFADKSLEICGHCFASKER